MPKAEPVSSESLGEAPKPVSAVVPETSTPHEVASRTPVDPQPSEPVKKAPAKPEADAELPSKPVEPPSNPPEQPQPSKAVEKATPPLFVLNTGPFAKVDGKSWLGSFHHHESVVRRWLAGCDPENELPFYLKEIQKHPQYHDFQKLIPKHFLRTQTMFIEFEMWLAKHWLSSYLGTAPAEAPQQNGTKPAVSDATASNATNATTTPAATTPGATEQNATPAEDTTKQKSPTGKNKENLDALPKLSPEQVEVYADYWKKYRSSPNKEAQSSATPSASPASAPSSDEPVVDTTPKPKKLDFGEGLNSILTCMPIASHHHRILLSLFVPRFQENLG